MNNFEISQYGTITLGALSDLEKALLAPGSVDAMYNTPGGAVTMQSLEMMLASLTLQTKDFVFWNDINKLKVFSTVLEFDQRIGVGQSYGGFVGQMDNPYFQDVDIRKEISIVKFMSEGWRVGDVQEATKTIVDVRTEQQTAAMIRLLRNLERALFVGNSDWIPESIDGLAKIIPATSGDQVFDMRGGNLSMSVFNLIGQLVTEGNGDVKSSKVYTSPAGVANIAKIVNEANGTFRQYIKSGDGGVYLGEEVTGISTNFGRMPIGIDKVLGMEFENNTVPVYYNPSTKTWAEGATADEAPSAPTTVAVAAVATVAGSKFAATGIRPSGVMYSYRVVGRNKYGKSIATAAVKMAAAVAAGGGVTITITPAAGDSANKRATCFEIYSEQVAGSGVFRYLNTIAANGTAAVVYTDANLYIPGTARMYIVDNGSIGESRVLSYAQLLPIHNTDLAKIDRSTRGLINLYGAVNYYKPTVLVEIRNIGVEQSNPNKFNNI